MLRDARCEEPIAPRISGAVARVSFRSPFSTAMSSDSSDATFAAAPDDEVAPASSPVLRQLIAFTALVSGLVALYLHLWKKGLMGALACGSGGGCQVVQFSSYGWFLGVDVALIGAIGYALIFIVAVLGTLPRNVDERWPTYALAALVYPAVLFTLRLKYAEFIVMHTFCPWCAVSAVTITLHAILVALDWVRLNKRGPG
jgi:uncharacterized membrane protein